MSFSLTLVEWLKWIVFSVANKFILLFLKKLKNFKTVETQLRIQFYFDFEKKWKVWGKSFLFHSLSLSLSHTHKHTHTHTFSIQKKLFPSVLIYLILWITFFFNFAELFNWEVLCKLSRNSKFYILLRQNHMFWISHHSTG